LAEIDQIAADFFAEREALEPVDQEELLARVRDGEVVVLGVRPPEEYRAGHIQGALSLPLAELEDRLAELPKDQEIVAHCRGAERSGIDTQLPERGWLSGRTSGGRSARSTSRWGPASTTIRRGSGSDAEHRLLFSTFAPMVKSPTSMEPLSTRNATTSLPPACRSHLSLRSPIRPTRYRLSRVKSPLCITYLQA